MPPGTESLRQRSVPLSDREPLPGGGSEDDDEDDDGNAGKLYLPAAPRGGACARGMWSRCYLARMTGRSNPTPLLALVAALHLAACAMHCHECAQRRPVTAESLPASRGTPAPPPPLPPPPPPTQEHPSLYSMSLWDVISTDPGTLLWRAVSQELGGAEMPAPALLLAKLGQPLDAPPPGASPETESAQRQAPEEDVMEEPLDAHPAAATTTPVRFRAVHVAHVHLVGIAVFVGAWLPCLYLRLGIYTRRAVWQCVAGAVLCFTASAAGCLAVFSQLSEGVGLCLSLQSVAHHLGAIWATCSLAPDYPLVAGTVPSRATFAGYKLAAQFRGTPGGLPKAAIVTGALLLVLYVQGGWGGDDLLAGWGLEKPPLLASSPGSLRDKGVVALLTHHAAAGVLLEVGKAVVYRAVLWPVLWGA